MVCPLERGPPPRTDACLFQVYFNNDSLLLYGIYTYKYMCIYLHIAKCLCTPVYIAGSIPYPVFDTDALYTCRGTHDHHVTVRI